jgi:hypothetical protein
MKPSLRSVLGVALLAAGLLAGYVRATQSLIDKAVPPGFGRRNPGDKNGPLKGLCEWPDRYKPDATKRDRTDYWGAIAISPSTGKYAASCEYMPFDLADRAARERCNAPDARTVVLCGNGWCSLALGDEKPGPDFGWGVGWAPTQQVAERNALEGARARNLHHPRVVYSIFSREVTNGGVIVYSESTGCWAWAIGGGLNAPYKARQNCPMADAKVIVQKEDGWLALALGDDKKAYGWGFAGNRFDAEKSALEACAERTRNAKLVCCFCTNGVVY